MERTVIVKHGLGQRRSKSEKGGFLFLFKLSVGKGKCGSLVVTLKPLHLGRTCLEFKIRRLQASGLRNVDFKFI